MGSNSPQDRNAPIKPSYFELPYWSSSTDHALVVVGYDEAHIFVNDPDRPEAEVPISIPRGDFELAWLERDYFYALVTPITAD